MHRLLKKHCMNRLPANQKHRPHGKRWQRYEKPQPGHRLQMDVKFLERIPGHRHTVVEEVLRRTRFGSWSSRPTTARNSNHSFTGTRRRGTSGTRTSVHGRRISTARSNGLTGSTTKSSISSWIGMASPNDIHLFNEKLREWEDYYDYHRHGGLAAEPFPRRLGLSRTESRRHTSSQRRRQIT